MVPPAGIAVHLVRDGAGRTGTAADIGRPRTDNGRVGPWARREPNSSTVRLLAAGRYGLALVAIRL